MTPFWIGFLNGVIGFCIGLVVGLVLAAFLGHALDEEEPVDDPRPHNEQYRRRE